ncbi:hypothetical protein ABK040_011363 [Willaertia magna]
MKSGMNTIYGNRYNAVRKEANSKKNIVKYNNNLFLGLLLDLEKKLIIAVKKKVQFLKKVIKSVLDFIKKKKRVKIRVIASIVGLNDRFFEQSIMIISIFIDASLSD